MRGWPNIDLTRPTVVRAMEHARGMEALRHRSAKPRKVQDGGEARTEMRTTS